jgi:hypothetical protein
MWCAETLLHNVISSSINRPHRQINATASPIQSLRNRIDRARRVVVVGRVQCHVQCVTCESRVPVDAEEVHAVVPWNAHLGRVLLYALTGYAAPHLRAAQALGQQRLSATIATLPRRL